MVSAPGFILWALLVHWLCYADDIGVSPLTGYDLFLFLFLSCKIHWMGSPPYHSSDIFSLNTPGHLGLACEDSQTNTWIYIRLAEAAWVLSDFVLFLVEINRVFEHTATGITVTAWLWCLWWSADLDRFKLTCNIYSLFWWHSQFKYWHFGSFLFMITTSGFRFKTLMLGAVYPQQQSASHQCQHISHISPYLDSLPHNSVHSHVCRLTSPGSNF